MKGMLGNDLIATKEYQAKVAPLDLSILIIYQFKSSFIHHVLLKNLSQKEVESMLGITLQKEVISDSQAITDNLGLSMLRCKNNERRSVVSAFKKLFPWTFDVKFQGGISLGSRKFVGRLNRGTT